MGSNGRHSLRVLLSGAAAHGVAATLEQDPAIDPGRADAAGAGSLDRPTSRST